MADPHIENTESELPNMGVSPGGPDRTVVDPPRSVFDFLPWRRPMLADDEGSELEPLLRLVRHRHPGADAHQILKAYAVARDAHAGQFRKSGDPYLSHPVAVATILADLGMDVTTITGGMLHDVVEDTSVSLEEIAEEFGEETAHVVDGVTKLDRLRFETREAQQAATTRKMLVAMANDIRVLVIKLADRLHNMRTLAPLSERKRRRLAQETLDIYAPLAHRLGIREIRWQLEDLAFQELHPKAFGEISGLVRQRTELREAEINQIVGDMERVLGDVRIPCDVTGRSKHLWAVYQKMVTRQRSFDEIYDIVGVRVVTGTIPQCYAALGQIHTHWVPVMGRFKDYVALPKFNLYQSIHTTVMLPQGRPVEVQIRTQDMHRIAEYGIAAHWRYKEGERPVSDSGPTSGAELGWFGRMMEWQGETEDPRDFMATLKGDLHQDEVFVFTPKGDVVTLPTSATPIDFAYSIHTEVGHRCIGARVNGRLNPLDSRLESGDTVEIFTSRLDGAGPSRDWLDVVATARARNRIRAWFNRESREEVVGKGREILERELDLSGMPVRESLDGNGLEGVAEELNYQHLAAMFAAIGAGHLPPDVIVARLVTDDAADGGNRPVPRSETPLRRSVSAEEIGVHVEDLDDVDVRLSKCCSPRPGDGIVGVLRRGRVSVHRNDCTNVSTKDRVVDVEWDTQAVASEFVTLHVEALDRGGLLADVTAAITEHHVDIRAARTATGRDQIAILTFEVEVSDTGLVDTLLRTVLEIDSVFEAREAMAREAPVSVGLGGEGSVRLGGIPETDSTVGDSLADGTGWS